MTLQELIEMTRFYTRDSNGLMFKEEDIIIFLNQAIDRIKQADKCFKFLRHIGVSKDESGKYIEKVYLLPEEYHYMLALFAASRCFDNDERFHEGVQKRNEFEQILNNLLADVQSGNSTAFSPENGNAGIDYVTDIYYNSNSEEEL